MVNNFTNIKKRTTVSHQTYDNMHEEDQVLVWDRHINGAWLNVGFCLRVFIATLNNSKVILWRSAWFVIRYTSVRAGIELTNFDGNG
jgi:hypothetical protein